jgi:hypothetical protein
MAIKSILKPDGSIGVGLATAGLVAGIYALTMPSTAQVHATDAGDINISAARKKATYTAATVLSGVTILTKDVNVFVLGGIVLFALDFNARHANSTDPDTGSLVSDAGYGRSQPTVAAT